MVPQGAESDVGSLVAGSWHHGVCHLVGIASSQNRIGFWRSKWTKRPLPIFPFPSRELVFHLSGEGMKILDYC